MLCQHNKYANKPVPDYLKVENGSLDNYCPCGCVGKCQKRSFSNIGSLTMPIATNNPPVNLCPRPDYSIPGIPPKSCLHRYKDRCCVENEKENDELKNRIDIKKSKKKDKKSKKSKKDKKSKKHKKDKKAKCCYKKDCDDCNKMNYFEKLDFNFDKKYQKFSTPNIVCRCTEPQPGTPHPDDHRLTVGYAGLLLQPKPKPRNYCPYNYIKYCVKCYGCIISQKQLKGTY